MALFRRNKTDQAGMPTEVQDYYKAEGRQRSGLAWLLALGTLLVTVVVVLGLFMGGRWAFRKLKNNDKPAPVAVQTDKTKDGGTKPAETTPDGDAPATSPAQTPPATTTSPAPAGSSTTAPSSTKNSNLPSTGPEDTLAIFVAVAVLAYIGHRRFLTS